VLCELGSKGLHQLFFDAARGVDAGHAGTQLRQL
jgi:hypothetical protein